MRSDSDFMVKAMSGKGWALWYATEELRSDEKMIQVAFANSNDTVVLRVRLLSGRCIHQIYCVQIDMEELKRDLASLLDLDPEHVVGSSTLLHGTATINSLNQLRIGEVHEVTLVLS